MKRVLLGLLILATAGCLIVATVGWALVRPVMSPVGVPPADLNAEAVEFATASGAPISAWWCPSDRNSATVLLLPGVRANRLSMLPRARFLHRAGYSVLLPDFEATGATKGEQITFGWIERNDVLAATKFIRGVRPTDRICIVGSSLGGAAALLATPPLRADALVLESVYPTIEQATQNRLRKYLGPIGPSLAPLLLMQLHARLGISVDQLRPLDHIANIRCPILVMVGEQDRNTTFRDTMLLYTGAQTKKELWIVPRVGHADLHRAAREEYERRVLAFFAQSGHN